MPSAPVPTSTSHSCQVCKKGGETLRCSKCLTAGRFSPRTSRARPSRLADTELYSGVDCQTQDWKAGHKGTCKGVTKKASSPAFPSVALLLTPTRDAAHLFHPLWHVVALKHANLTTTNTLQDAITLLESPKQFGAIIVDGDPMFQPSDSKTRVLALKLQKLIKAYTLGGGRTILLGGWIAEHDQLQPFALEYGLRWRAGWYGRSSYVFNKSFSPLNTPSLPPALTPSALAHLSRPLQRTPTSGCTLLPGYAQLPAHLRLRGSGKAPPPPNASFTKALGLWDVEPKHALYLPTPGARSSLSGEEIEPSTALATMARVGERGWLGYMGDVEMDEEMVPALLAMAGCVIKSGVLLP